MVLFAVVLVARGHSNALALTENRFNRHLYRVTDRGSALIANLVGSARAAAPLDFPAGNPRLAALVAGLPLPPDGYEQ
jgi:hypothetical protein